MEKKIFDPARCKNKQFYELLIPKKTMVSRGFTKLKDDFDLDDITVSKAFLNLKDVSSETFRKTIPRKQTKQVSIFSQSRNTFTCAKDFFTWPACVDHVSLLSMTNPKRVV